MRRFVCVLSLVLLISALSQASITVATFANPSPGSSQPLFTVDWAGSTVTGSWGDSKNGLTLELPNEGGASYINVWFQMTTVTMNTPQIVPGAYGTTSGGTISFYADGTTNLLYEISFDSGVISKFGFGSDDNVKFSGSALTKTYQDEQFSFAFAAKNPTSGGFTATAAFDASGTIPEPASLALIGLGGLFLRKRNGR